MHKTPRGTRRNAGTCPLIYILCSVAACAVLVWGVPALAEDPGHEAGGADHGHDHGEGAGDDAHGGAGAHGGGHGERASINWFSFDYGHGKRKDGTAYKHANAPLGFSIMNFAILIFLLVKFTRKPISSYLANRADEIEKALEEAAFLRDAAKAKLAEIDGKLASLDVEVEQIKKDVAKDAELEKGRIIENAEAEAARIVKQAETSMQREIRRAKKSLEAEVVTQSLRVAEEMISKNINNADRKRLNEEFIAQIAS